MKKILFISALSLSFVYCNAQYYYDRNKNPEKIVEKTSRDFDHFFYLSWDYNKPLSNQDYISQASSLGTKLGFRKRLNSEDKFWVGADFGWSVYKQYYPPQVYTNGTQSTYTDLYNYTYAYNLAVNIDYFFFPMDKLFAPYAGLGIGGTYNKYSQFFNVYEATASSWGLLLRPEVGVLVGFKENSSWRLKVAYHYDYSSNSNKDFGFKNFNNTGFQIGIVKMAW